MPKRAHSPRSASVRPHRANLLAEYSGNDGATWTQVTGLSGPRVRPVADPVDPKAFYAYDGAHLLASSDGGGIRVTAGAPGSTANVTAALKPVSP